jgi:hypothetical protein
MEGASIDPALNHPLPLAHPQVKIDFSLRNIINTWTIFTFLLARLEKAWQELYRLVG